MANEHDEIAIEQPPACRGTSCRRACILAAAALSMCEPALAFAPAQGPVLIQRLATVKSAQCRTSSLVSVRMAAAGNQDKKRSPCCCLRCRCRDYYAPILSQGSHSVAGFLGLHFSLTQFFPDVLVPWQLACSIGQHRAEVVQDV